MAARGRPAFHPTDRHRGQVDAMTRYGIPVAEIARVLGITKPTLFKHFRDELDVGMTKANAQVGEFIFSTIVGMPIPGRPAVTDGRARAALAMFWAKSKMGWKETTVIEHKDGDLDEDALRRRIDSKIARLVVHDTTDEVPEAAE
jgi:AcrR family transcriptional regulator